MFMIKALILSMKKLIEILKDLPMKPLEQSKGQKLKRDQQYLMMFPGKINKIKKQKSRINRIKP